MEKLNEVLTLIRGIQRPFLIFTVMGALVGITVYLAINYSTPEMARDAVIFLFGVGGTITGFLFRDRMKGQNNG